MTDGYSALVTVRGGGTELAKFRLAVRGEAVRRSTSDAENATYFIRETAGGEVFEVDPATKSYRVGTPEAILAHLEDFPLGADFNHAAEANRRGIKDYYRESDAVFAGNACNIWRFADRPDAFTGPPTAAKRLLDRLAATDPARGGTSPPRDRGPILTAGARLADRYVIESLVGEGSSGRVYRATDEVLRTTVAVKVLDLEAGEELRQLRREAATLRWLRVPGVVNLQDDGVDGGRPYIVTDLVVGAPFPGSPAAPTWASMRDAAVALLETLARIHAQGVIHGDLKPSNVLVDAHGIPTVLDVGIASGPSIEFGAGEDDDFVAGTPSYMAPERIGGAPASVATDLYAVGVMLHEALCGQVPHHATSRTGLFDRRRLEEARPLRELAPDAPPDAARMIDALLARDATRRPASAYDALDLLEHLRHVRPGNPDFPWLGSRALIDRLVEAAREGRSLDVWGPPGAGKTRTLREAARAVEAQGRRVIWVSRAGSIESSAAPTATADAEVLRMLPVVASGTVLVLDDADIASPEALLVAAACRPAGSVWFARDRETPGAVAVPRLNPSDF